MTTAANGPADFPPDDVPELAFSGATARITLRRPRQHNRIDPSDIPVMRAHLEQIRGREDVRLVVFTGTGGKTFSSGYTVQAIVEKLDRNFEDLLDAVETFPLPTVCAMNGSVYGGATDLAVCCDFRIGVEGSRMFMPAAKFGLHYYPGGLRRFVTRLGPFATKWIFLTARSIEAGEMLRIGYLTELVPREALDRTVAAYEALFAEGEPGVVREMKRQINGLASGTWEEAEGRRLYEASLRSPVLAERLARRK